jgi:hypothetical protein
LDESILRRIPELSQSNPNFPRLLNRDLGPVIQNGQIQSPSDPASTLFISGIPSVIDTFRQFVTHVSAVFHRLDRTDPIQLHNCDQLIADNLIRNDILGQYPREGLDSVQNLAMASITGPDQGMNLAIFNADGSLLIGQEIEAVKNCYQTNKLSQNLMLYDQLVYALIFWDGHGGCGSANSIIGICPPEPDFALTLFCEDYPTSQRLQINIILVGVVMILNQRQRIIISNNNESCYFGLTF